MPTFFNSWLPFLYLYGVGGFFFFLGLFLIKKYGAIDLTKKHHKFWLKVMVFGYFYFVVIHFLLIIAALYL